MFYMLNNRLLRRTARPSSQGGFTLVELLVVIGIIAILAGVALGPITSGIKKAAQSSGVQTTRTLALAEFQYANDNNAVYPSGATSDVIAKSLFVGNYISDPNILYISGSSATKFTGTAPSTGIAVANISYDFVQLSSGAGLSSNTPDQCPVILSCVNNGTAVTFNPAVVNSTSVVTTSPFGEAGAAICYHSNSAKFVTATGVAGTRVVALTDASIPATSAVTIPGKG